MEGHVFGDHFVAMLVLLIFMAYFHFSDEPKRTFVRQWSRAAY